jgi:DNA-directed RNA polymerase subunit RPC12/RpoP
MSYLGKADCGTCGNEVDVRSNVSGRAYYKCGRCGVSVQHKEERGHRLFTAKIRAEADPDEAPAVVRESPRIAEPKAAVKPVETPKKTEAPKPRAGLFGGLLSGA